MWRILPFSNFRAAASVELLRPSPSLTLHAYHGCCSPLPPCHSRSSGEYSYSGKVGGRLTQQQLQLRSLFHMMRWPVPQTAIVPFLMACSHRCFVIFQRMKQQISLKKLEEDERRKEDARIRELERKREVRTSVSHPTINLTRGRLTFELS